MPDGKPEFIAKVFFFYTLVQIKMPQARGLARKQIVDFSEVTFCRQHVSDGEPDRHSPAQKRVRQVRAARGIDGLDQRPVKFISM